MDRYLGASLCFQTVASESDPNTRGIRKFSKNPPEGQGATRQYWNRSVQSFCRGVQGQKEVAAAGYSSPRSSRRRLATYVAPVHRLSERGDSNWECLRPDCGISLQSLLATAWQPTHAQLFAIVAGIVAGLQQIKQVKNRGHGNLKLSNVLIQADHGRIIGTYTSRRWKVFLTDFLWESDDPGSSEGSGDLRKLGRMLYEIVVLGRPLRSEQGERFAKAGLQEREPWLRLDFRKGDAWRQFCSSLHDAVADNLTLEDVLVAVQKLDPSLGVPWRRKAFLSKNAFLGISTGTALVGVGAVLAYRQAPLFLGAPEESNGGPDRLLRYAIRTFSLTTPNFQWLTNGVAIPSETNRDLAVTPDWAGSSNILLGVVARNAFGTSTSLFVKLRSGHSMAGEGPPTLSVPAAVAHVKEGSVATLRGFVRSKSPGIVQWRDSQTILSEAPIDARPEYTLDLKDVRKRTHNRKVYSLIASNSAGVTSLTVSLSVTQGWPEVTVRSEPRGEYAVVGQEYVYQVQDLSDRYEWYREPNKSIERSSRVVFLGPQFRFQPQSTNEPEWIALVASNDERSTTNWYRRRLVEPPRFSPVEEPVRVVIDPGQRYEMPRIRASGTEPIFLLWYRNEVQVAVTTNGDSWSLRPDAAVDLTGSYRVEATNAWGQASRQIAIVSLREPQTASGTVLAPLPFAPSNLVSTITRSGQKGLYSALGNSALLGFPNGPSDFSYEWFRNGTRLDARGPLHQIKTVGPADVGDYEVRVASKNGAFTNNFYLWVEVTNSMGMELVWVPGVRGMKGGAWVGRYEVSQYEFQKMMNVNPSDRRKESDAELRNYPAEKFTPQMAMEFLTKLNQQMPISSVQGQYMLPTESQFQSIVGDFDETKVNVANNSRLRQMEASDARPPNRHGLCQVIGNLFELTTDSRGGTYFKALGGAFDADLGRYNGTMGDRVSSRSYNLGMRVFLGEPSGD